MTAPGDHDQPPLLAIVAGDPSAEQIAAVVAVKLTRRPVPGGRPDPGYCARQCCGAPADGGPARCRAEPRADDLPEPH